jgi:hypothetical protein
MVRHLIGLLAFALASALSAGLVLVVKNAAPALSSLEVSRSADPRAADNQPSSLQAAKPSDDAEFPRITFRGTLQAYSPRPTYACGTIFVHQVARYQIDEVLDGAYGGTTIIVDHPACDGNRFAGFKRGDRVQLTVSVRPQYSDITVYRGIRDSDDVRGPFYIAESALARQR